MLASAAWTYISIITKPVSGPPNIINLEVKPNYRIISGKALKIWPKGTVFEQGMAAYFYAAMPEVIISPVIQITGMGQGQLTGTIKSRVMLQAVNDKSEVYWSYQLQDIPQQPFIISQGESQTADLPAFTAPDISLDAVGTYDLATSLSDELMFKTGLFQAAVISDISVNGSADGNLIDKTVTQTLTLSLQQVSFTIPRTEDFRSTSYS